MFVFAEFIIRCEIDKPRPRWSSAPRCRPTYSRKDIRFSGKENPQSEEKKMGSLRKLLICEWSEVENKDFLGHKDVLKKVFAVMSKIPARLVGYPPFWAWMGERLE